MASSSKIHGVGNPHFQFTPPDQGQGQETLPLAIQRRQGLLRLSPAALASLRQTELGAIRLKLHPNLYEDDQTILRRYP